MGEALDRLDKYRESAGSKPVDSGALDLSALVLPDLEAQMAKLGPAKVEKQKEKPEESDDANEPSDAKDASGSNLEGEGDQDGATRPVEPATVAVSDSQEQVTGTPGEHEIPTDRTVLPVLTLAAFLLFYSLIFFYLALPLPLLVGLLIYTNS